MNPKYTDEKKAKFRRNPQKLKDHRHELAHTFNHFYEALIKGFKVNNKAMRRTKEMMQNRLKGQPELAAKLIPQ